jgi:RNA polymerase sigma-70 factor, ECF subfamily
MAQDGVAAGLPVARDRLPSPTGVDEVVDSHAHLPSRTDVTAPVDVSAPEPFEQFYRRELPRLAALAQALCGVESADDVAQEAMLVAYRRWPEVSGYTSPEAWVRRVCANKATSTLRRRGAEMRALLRLSARPGAEGSSPEHEAFWAEVRRLPRRQAQAAGLRYVYDMSLEDIAAVLGCSSGAVKVHLSRARKALGERLTGAEEENS